MPLFAGIDVGGSSIKYGLVESGGGVQFKGRTTTPDTTEEFLACIDNLWRQLGAQSHEEIAAAGLGLPGLFQIPAQKIARAPHCPFLDGLDLSMSLKEIIQVPLFLHNEANLAAFGEYKVGGGRDSRIFVLVTIGSGIGTGILFNGKLWEGSCGFAGELGHIPVSPAEHPCPCGNRGCLETEVSAGAVLRTYRSLDRVPDSLSVKEIGSLAAQGDRAARAAFEQSGRFLGKGLAVIVNFLNPDAILLGGGVMGASKFLLPAAVAEAKKRSFAAALSCCRIEPARLGNEAGFIGAALWAGQKLFEG